MQIDEEVKRVIPQTVSEAGSKAKRTKFKQVTLFNGAFAKRLKKLASEQNSDLSEEQVIVYQETAEGLIPIACEDPNKEFSF